MILKILFGFCLFSSFCWAVECDLEEPDRNSPTFENLCNTLGGNRSQVSSMANVLRSLAASQAWNTARENAVMMFRSRALGFNGEPSQPFPRIILNNGNLFLTIKADKASPDSNIIEIIENLPQLNEIRFREIKVENGRLLCDSEADRLSPTGSRKCSQCHNSSNIVMQQRQEGPNSRFIMPNFHIGAYGRLDGVIPVGSPQHDEMSQFLRARTDNPARMEFYEILGIRRPATQANGDFILTGNPNERLRRRLDQMNARRIAAQIISHREFSRYRYLIAGALLNCENFDTFLPGNRLGSLASRAIVSNPFSRSNNVPRFESGTLAISALENTIRDRQRLNREHRYFEESYPGDEAPRHQQERTRRVEQVEALNPVEVASKLHVASMAMGLDSGTWPIESDGPRSTFRYTGNGQSGSANGIDYITCLVLPESIRGEANLGGFQNGIYHPSHLTRDKANYCRTLASRSREVQPVESTLLHPHSSPPSPLSPEEKHNN